MAKIILTSSPIVSELHYDCSITGKPVTCYSVAPFQNVIPPETIEARNVAEIAAALDSYAERAKATGARGEATAIFPRQNGRKPAGFDTAKRAAQLSRMFNLAAAQ